MVKSYLSKIKSEDLRAELHREDRLKEYAFSKINFKRGIRAMNQPKDFGLIIKAPTQVMAMERFELLFPGISSYTLERL